MARAYSPCPGREISFVENLRHCARHYREYVSNLSAARRAICEQLNNAETPQHGVASSLKFGHDFTSELRRSGTQSWVLFDYDDDGV